MKLNFLFGIIASLTLCTLLSIGCIEENGNGKELRISNIVFCSEEPTDYMEYKEQADATYQPGDTVYVYFNLQDQKYNENSDGTNEMWFTQYLTLTGPNGDILISQEVVNEHKNFPEEQDPDMVWLMNEIPTTTDVDTGKYTVKIDITDKLADKTASASSSFWITL